MPTELRVLGMRHPSEFDPNKSIIVNVCSNSDEVWSTDLSPFKLGPCPLYGGMTAQVMENAWQYAKVYAQHLKGGEPTEEYWTWAKAGFADYNAHRFPMGRGARPAFSLWDGQKLNYIEARKKIYAPLYAEAVQKTAGYAKLKELFLSEDKVIILRDFDGYDHIKMGQTLTQVLNNSRKKCGHSFVLVMLLTCDAALKQCAMR